MSLPDYVILLPDSVKTVLIAQTDRAEMVRYERGQSGLQPSAVQPISIGENGVGKVRTGDRKTPLGIYFIVETLPTTYLHEKYGPVAFPLDYPNARDVSLDRTGHGIWIHGVDPNAGPRPARDTDGCIALPNEELLSLQPFLTPLTTPVIVTQSEIEWDAETRDALREQLMARLASWSASYRDGDWHAYVSHYDEAFSARGLNRNEWLSFRAQSQADRSINDIHIDEVLLIQDPEETDLYLSRFQQTIVTDDTQVQTTKRLYWRRHDSGALKIVTEDNG